MRSTCLRTNLSQSFTSHINPRASQDDRHSLRADKQFPNSIVRSPEPAASLLHQIDRVQGLIAL